MLLAGISSVSTTGILRSTVANDGFVVGIGFVAILVGNLLPVARKMDNHLIPFLDTIDERVHCIDNTLPVGLLIFKNNDILKLLCLQDLLNKRYIVL